MSKTFIIIFIENSSAYQATIPANLWASLADHVPSNVLPSDVSLQDILYNWVEKSGHPAVLVTKSGNDVILTQVSNASISFTPRIGISILEKSLIK